MLFEGKRSALSVWLWTATAAVLAALMAFLPANADASSLPNVASGQRPGPKLLYMRPPVAPQLQNTGIWRAKPILVSGAEAYRSGEFLYQDFLYDDRGAAGTQDPTDPMDQALHWANSHKAGTLTYPTAPGMYDNNSADLVEFRVKPLAEATAFRVTLNTLVDPERAAFTIALGESSTPVPWPHEANISSPAALFLTVHGTYGELLDATTGAEILPAPSVVVDTGRRQFEVRVPHAAWDPGRGVVRLAAGVGIWDTANDHYATPVAEATETSPGGAAASRAALFNMAFRLHEPTPERPGKWPIDATEPNPSANTFWREHQQAELLASGDVTPLYADVDFGKLWDGVKDESAVPRSGSIDRIFASHFSYGQGVDYTKLCGGGIDPNVAHPCYGAFVGQLQSYQLYIPSKPRPRSGYGLTFYLHGQAGNHNSFWGYHSLPELAERASSPSLVLVPSDRGPDGFCHENAEANVFEAWSDVARNYRLNPNWSDVGGYSMGGGCTWSLLARWPDLFARATAGGAIPGTGTGSQSDSYLNVPIQAWLGTFDEGTLVIWQEAAIASLLQAGLRFDWLTFPYFEHASMGEDDEITPMAQFLGTALVDRDPQRVRYFVDPSWDYAAAGLIGDHAYWLSNLRLREGGEGKTGIIDVRSGGFGTGDPTPTGLRVGSGSLEGGTYPEPQPYIERSQGWGEAPTAPVGDELTVSATNIGSLTIDPGRARVSCQAELQVTTDGPLQITLAGCGRTVSFG